VLVVLPRRVGMAFAREMSLTGNFVDADTALRVGLANHVVPHDELRTAAIELARAIAEQDPAMVRLMRHDWNATDRLPLEDAHRVHMEHAEQGGFTSIAGTDIAAHHDAVVQRAREQR
jgi:enoyl-CoA hydratase